MAIPCDHPWAEQLAGAEGVAPDTTGPPQPLLPTAFMVSWWNLSASK